MGTIEQIVWEIIPSEVVFYALEKYLFDILKIMIKNFNTKIIMLYFLIKHNEKKKIKIKNHVFTVFNFTYFLIFDNSIKWNDSRNANRRKKNGLKN